MLRLGYPMTREMYFRTRRLEYDPAQEQDGELESDLPKALSSIRTSAATSKGRRRKIRTQAGGGAGAVHACGPQTRQRLSSVSAAWRSVSIPTETANKVYDALAKKLDVDITRRTHSMGTSDGVDEPIHSHAREGFAGKD